MVRILFILLALASVGSVHAAPLVHFALEGRKQGTDDPFLTELPVSVGDVVEYRLRTYLNPPITPYELIRKNDLGTTLHGLNSLSLEISQDSDTGIQVDFTAPSVLTADSYAGAGDGWGSGTGAGGGSPLRRAGTAFHDLTDIRPIHAPGVFTALDWETVLTGTFQVASVAGSSAQVRGMWATDIHERNQRSGGGYWNGGTFFPTRLTELGPDPYTDYVPLTLTAVDVEAVPEPSTLALLGAMTAVLVVVRRTRARTM